MTTATAPAPAPAPEAAQAPAQAQARPTLPDASKMYIIPGDGRLLVACEVDGVINVQELGKSSINNYFLRFNRETNKWEIEEQQSAQEGRVELTESELIKINELFPPPSDLEQTPPTASQQPGSETAEQPQSPARQSPADLSTADLMNLRQTAKSIGKEISGYYDRGEINLQTQFFVTEDGQFLVTETTVSDTTKKHIGFWRWQEDSNKWQLIAGYTQVSDEIGEPINPASWMGPVSSQIPDMLIEAKVPFLSTQTPVPPPSPQATPAPTSTSTSFDIEESPETTALGFASVNVLPTPLGLEVTIMSSTDQPMLRLVPDGRQNGQDRIAILKPDGTGLSEQEISELAALGNITPDQLKQLLVDIYEAAQDSMPQEPWGESNNK